MSRNYIGGELSLSPFAFFKKKQKSLEQSVKERFPEKEALFTGGGHYSLLTIINAIDFKEDDVILLPSYICPSVLFPFKEKKVSFKFYQVCSNLDIDLDDLKKQLSENVKAVFFINYFGFHQNFKIILFLQSLKSRGIIIIEDLVHSYFSNHLLTGDFAFNSLRKFLPIDGSVILSNNRIEPLKKGKINSYSFLQFSGRILKNIFRKLKLPLDGIYLRLFEWADQSYYSNRIIGFNTVARYIFSRLDIQNLINRKRVLYEYLLTHLKEVALYKDLPDNITPLCFPIMIDNRDELRTKLMSLNVYCPVHWTLSKDIDEYRYKNSYEVSRRILSIPINEANDENDYKSLIKMIKENLLKKNSYDFDRTYISESI